MLENILKSLEIPAEQVAAYLALLSGGHSTVAALARTLDVPRTTVHGHLKQLEEKGLATHHAQGGGKIWEAASPESITALFDRRLYEVEEMKERFKGLLPALLSSQAADFIKPAFRYFEGIEGLRLILRDVMMYRDDVTQCFWPMSDMLDVLGQEFLHEINIQRIRQNLSIKAIWPEGKRVDFDTHYYLSPGLEFLREVRIAPRSVECTMGYWAYANKVAFVSSRKECFGFVVESAELRQMHRATFDLIWQMSAPILPSPAGKKKLLEDLRRK